VRAEDYTALAERHTEAGDRAGALKFLKRSVESDGTNMEVRALYAERCRAAGMVAEATSEYKTLAQLAREREDYKHARSYYETLVEMNPSEHQVQQRLYEMLVSHDDPGAVQAGLALAATYQRLELRAERAELLRGMARENATDAYVLEQLGEAESALGRRPEAGAALSQAGRLCADAGQVARACLLFEKALQATPDDARLMRTLDELRTGVFRARRERRRRVGLVVGVSVAALLLAAYCAYNARAGWAYLGLRNDNLQRLAAGEYEQVRASIDAFGARYPWSLVLMDRSRYRAAVDTLVQAHEAVGDSLAHLQEAVTRRVVAAERAAATAAVVAATVEDKAPVVDTTPRATFPSQ
jgi:tetratricopeptide (TPR) repeat protein